jgi:hypothetical protein
MPKVNTSTLSSSSVKTEFEPVDEQINNPIETIQDIGSLKEKSRANKKTVFSNLIDKFTRWI